MTLPRPSSRRGFTLIEVMVALTIMGIIMVALYATLYTTLDTRDKLAYEARMVRAGPMVLDIVEEDLRRAWTLNLDEDPFFVGEARSLLSESADVCWFLTTVDSTSTMPVGEDQEARTSDLCETGYRLRLDPDQPGTDVMELWRRQQFHVDDKPLEGGTYERLHDRVVGFELRYWADYDREAEPLEEWDTRERHALPALVSVRLGIETGALLDGGERPEEGRSRTLWYERLIPLQRSSSLAMRARPRPPRLVGAVTTAPGGGGGGPAGDGADGGPGGGGGGGGGDGPQGDNRGPGDGAGTGDGDGGQGDGGGPNGGLDTIVDQGDGATDLDDIFDELFGGG